LDENQISEAPVVRRRDCR